MWPSFRIAAIYQRSKTHLLQFGLINSENKGPFSGIFFEATSEITKEGSKRAIKTANKFNINCAHFGQSRGEQFQSGVMGWGQGGAL